MSSLRVSDFTEHPAARAARDHARTQCEGRRLSDLVDGDGHQYVDLVMEGGGVLGVALVGYTWVLEEVGLRFLGVGGTSAGAINATLVAGAAPPSEAKAERILTMLVALDMFSFVDGDRDAQRFVRGLLDGAGKWRMIWRGFRVLDTLRDHLGLNPGHTFEHWLKDRLDACGVRSVAELEARMRDLPDDMRQVDADGRERPVEGELKPRLKLITAEVSTRSQITFPEMADLFWEDPSRVHPARFVRCSMSIPYFFRPARQRKLPQGAAAEARWAERVGFDGGVPPEAVFVDGGVLSNFPVHKFHVRGRVPRAPTLGVKLDNDREVAHAVTGPINLFGNVFNSARQVLDLDFFLRNPDYRQLVGTITTGPSRKFGTGKFPQGHNWLDFFLADEAKVDLFVRGAQAAARFLEGFDWPRYRKTRESLLEAERVAGAPADPQGGGPAQVEPADAN